MIKKEFALTVMALLVLLFLAGSYWYGEIKYDAGHHILDTGDTTASPIIITDGGSIHFAQKDRWSYLHPHKIAARLPGHKAIWVKYGLCTLNANTQTTDNSCDTPITNKDLSNATSWSLDVCEGNNCTRPALQLHWPTAHEASGHIEVMLPQSFLAEDNTYSKDGPSLKIDNLHLTWMALTVDNVTVPAGACTSTMNKKCTVRICYAENSAICN